jgi:hypothetical protein
LGGLNESFTIPGGGLVNLDFYKRAVSSKSEPIVILFGEGCFHQVHSGISSNISTGDLLNRWKQWNEDYKKINGEYWEKADVSYKTVYFGNLHPSTYTYIQSSAQVRLDKQASSGVAPIIKPDTN